MKKEMQTLVKQFESLNEYQFFDEGKIVANDDYQFHKSE